MKNTSKESIRELDCIDNPKVFCIGLERTGTQSLGTALTTLGYNVTRQNPVGRPSRIGALYKIRCINLSYKFGAFQNNQWPLVYWEMHQLWPNAKFILTTREPDSWMQSMTTVFGGSSIAVRRFIYGGIGDPLGNEVVYLDRKKRHEYDVHKYFARHPNTLLTMNVEGGDDYDRLCKFLDKPTPSDNYPHDLATK